MAPICVDRRRHSVFLETAAPAVVSDGSDLLVAVVSYPYLGGFLIVAVVVWSWNQQLFEHRGAGVSGFCRLQTDSGAKQSKGILKSRASQQWSR